MYSVLFVDDEPELREIGKSFLKRYRNLNVTTVASAQEALHHLTISTYDIIISDYQMPEMDGIAFLKELRNSRHQEPFILFTGRGCEKIVIEALNNGADFYLPKEGNPRLLFAELVDMIQKSVEKRRKELEFVHVSNQSKAIINHLPDPTVAIDTKGSIICWNKALEEITGFPESDLLGKKLSDCSEYVFGESGYSLADYMLNPDIGLQQCYEGLSYDGKTITAERWMNFGSQGKRKIWIKASPLYDESDTIIGAIESMRDITLIKELELELSRRYQELNTSYETIAAQNEEIRSRLYEVDRQKELLLNSERKFRSFIEHLPDGAIIHRDNVIRYVNPMACQILGYDDPTGLIGKKPQEIIDPKSREAISDRIILDDTQISPFVKGVLRGQDGRPVTVEIAAKKVLIGESLSLMLIFRDITHDIEKRHALLQAQKKLKMLSSITRHDIKNELGTVMAILDLVSLGNIPSQEAELLKQAFHPCMNIIKQLQTTFEYQNLGILDPKWFQVSSLCFHAARYHQVDHSLYSFTGDDAHIFADPLIEKVFENLIDNSIRHGKNLKSIQFKAEKENDDLIIIYEDDGGGIPVSEKTIIFEEGYGKHTGLGLFLIREILTMTGIEILECGQPGVGVRFEMRIPRGKWKE